MKERKITIVTFSMVLIFVLLLLVNIEKSALGITCRDFEAPEGLCIEIEFISMKEDQKTPSKYEFPEFVSINDYLVIRKITVINKPGIVEETRSTPNLTLKIDMYPRGLEEEVIRRSEENPSSTIDIPSLNVNDIYEMTYLNAYARYQTRLNNHVVDENKIFPSYPKNLFTGGEWVIAEELEPPIGHSTIFNGRWKNNFFKVYSNYEITDLRRAKNNLWISMASLVVIIAVGLATILFSRNQEKSINKITEELKDTTGELRAVATSLTTLTEKQAGYINGRNNDEKQEDSRTEKKKKN